MKCMSVLYKNGDGVTFNFDYYNSKHIPLFVKTFGKAVHKVEVRKGIAAPGGPKPMYIAIANIYIADEAAFAAIAAQHMGTFAADLPNYTQQPPVVEQYEICLEMAS